MYFRKDILKESYLMRFLMMDIEILDGNRVISKADL